ncbi:STN domain-containing protein [Bradyrhizobium sp. Leo170]|uniref:STN domain-containing protein n=1 Tax=Bradyrhizobium sp. Leo170 TaxID=1571199 RepID=UPI00102E3542|nr:STN domain-containing protein [Bradyrhizobium sp. Leo170]TAI61007.1 energy transducer TonB [Bradyrhizobium sp. Leo170]
MTAIRSYVAYACAVTDGKTVERSRGQRHLTWICALLVITGVCAAIAEERRAATVSEPIGFHIPAQPLAIALQAYGERTGVQVLYESNSATGRKSAAVEGNFTAEQALNLLLAGTDLKVQYTRPDAITLALPSATTGGPPASPLGSADLSLGMLRVRASNDGDDVGRLHDYSESLQIDIQKALQKNVRTRGGSYRAVLDLWIDRSRTVQRTELFRSTGDVERDAAVATVLRGLTISRSAPANTPRPVRIVIVVKPLQ